MRFVDSNCLRRAKDWRSRIELEDRLKLVEAWDDVGRDAFRLVKAADQPLWPLVREKAGVEQSVFGHTRVPSSRLHVFEQNDQSCR
jgi:hypothetical protein